MGEKLKTLKSPKIILFLIISIILFGFIISFVYAADVIYLGKKTSKDIIYLGNNNANTLASSNFAANALALVSSSATPSANIGGNVQIKCNFGVPWLGCVNAKHGNNNCVYSSYSGMDSIWNCAPTVTGVIDNYCNLVNNANIPGCVAQTNKIPQTTNVVSANALTLVSSSASGSVNLGGNVQVKCNFGVPWLGCVQAKHGNNNCVYAGYSGMDSIWNCAPTVIGVIDNYCNLVNNPSISGCAAQTNKIPQSTNVVNANALTLVSSSASASANIGGNVQVKCNFGVPWLGCVQAKHGNNNCVYAGYSGMDSIWNCAPTVIGVIDNYCNLVNNPSISGCAAQTNKIQSTNVVICTLSCAGKICGDDGCGGSCGNCGSGQTCSNGQCINSVIYEYKLFNLERRFYANGFHFMTILTDANGAIAIRPHPGNDVNGWGSTLYMQPFLPGSVLRGTTIKSINVYNGGINIVASGIVSQGNFGNYGIWDSNYNFNYNPALKEINGNGKYNVYLNGNVNTNTGDLALYKLASNYLNDVPLLDGSVGDTGDMKYANISEIPFPRWVPESQPQHYPQDFRSTLTVEAIGNYNQVDSVKLGYNFAMAAAYKPSMKVKLMINNPGVQMIFGGQYDTNKGRDPFADNVGMTPLIIKNLYSDKTFNIDVEFNSKAIPGDH